MKRGEFLKRLGIGVGAAIVAPTLLTAKENAKKYHESEPIDEYADKQLKNIGCHSCSVDSCPVGCVATTWADLV